VQVDRQAPAKNFQMTVVWCFPPTLAILTNTQTHRSAQKKFLVDPLATAMLTDLNRLMHRYSFLLGHGCLVDGLTLVTPMAMNYIILSIAG